MSAEYIPVPVGLSVLLPAILAFGGYGIFGLVLLGTFECDTSCNGPLLSKAFDSCNGVPAAL